MKEFASSCSCKGDSAPEVSYADKAGKYMGQRGVSLPRM